MTTIQTRTEEIYAELKLADRMTPGRTPWQTLRKRAEELAATEEAPVAEAEALDTMTDRELVAYWNIMQYPFHTTEKDARHRGIVSSLLTARGITHERGRLTAAAA